MDPTFHPSDPTGTDRSEADALLKNRTPHGKLRSCAYRASSSGMMKNSNTLWDAKITREKNHTVIILREKEALHSEHTKKYRPKTDVFSEIEAFVEIENLAALAELKEKTSPFQLLDYSSSADIRLVFDDPADAFPDEICISITALEQNGVGHLADTLHRMITDAIEQAKHKRRRRDS